MRPVTIRHDCAMRPLKHVALQGLCMQRAAGAPEGPSWLTQACCNHRPIRVSSLVVSIGPFRLATPAQHGTDVQETPLLHEQCFSCAL